MQQKTDDAPVLALGPPCIVSGEGNKVVYGLHIDGALQYGGALVLTGWVIGDQEIRFSDRGDSPLHSMAVSYFERPDVRSEYQLDMSIKAQGILCILHEFPTDVLITSGFVGDQRVVSVGAAVPPVSPLAPIQAFLRNNLDKSGALFAFLHTNAAWLSLLAPLLQDAPATQKFAMANIEDARLVPGVGGLAVGWAFSAGNAELFVVSREGGCRKMDEAVRWHRPDIVEVFANSFGNATHNAGFVIRAPEATTQESEVIVICATKQHAWRLSSKVIDTASADAVTFARWSFNLPTWGTHFEKHFSTLDGPIVAHLVKAQKLQVRQIAPTVFEFGSPVEAPVCSIVIPLYGRYDFMYNQLLEFSDDKFIRERVELVYVVDDPRIASNVLSEASSLLQYYGVRFRVINGGINRGYSAANNVGVRYCTTPYIALLNSDVIPLDSGWLEPMIQALDADSNVGIVGARLRYANYSLQHDGVAFQWHPQWKTYINKHPGMGMDPPPASPTPVRQLAVTGACMLFSRETFDAVDGLDDEYLVGDFEDTDFCLKVRSLGKEIMCVQNVNLIHLERQSFIELGGGAFRTRVTHYNALRHHQRWGETIARLMSTAKDGK